MGGGGDCNVICGVFFSSQSFVYKSSLSYLLQFQSSGTLSTCKISETCNAG